MYYEILVLVFTIFDVLYVYKLINVYVEKISLN